LERACFKRGISAVSSLASRSVVGLVLVLLAIHHDVRGDNGWEGQSLSVTWENDAIARSDRHYTQGARISYLSRDDALPGWFEQVSEWLPAIGLDIEAQKYGLAVGQDIYTPEDLRNPHLIPDDRPYAGWLFGSLALQRRGKTSARWRALETFRLDLGVVGPESYAEQTQKHWHGVDPQGWDHQLGTEPGAVFRYERRYLFSGSGPTGSGWGYHMIPNLGGSFGNIATDLSTGTTLRFGYNIPNEFEAQRTALRFGLYVFGGAQGRFVVRNIFMDGNTFRSSHSVDKKPLVGDLKAGVTVVLKRLEVTVSYVGRTREFNDQKTSDSFGSATITVKF